MDAQLYYLPIIKIPAISFADVYKKLRCMIVAIYSEYDSYHIFSRD